MHGDVMGIAELSSGALGATRWHSDPTGRYGSLAPFRPPADRVSSRSVNRHTRLNFGISEITLAVRPKSVVYARCLVPLEGRIAIVTDAGWDAVDASVPLTNGTEAAGEGVGSRRPD